MKKIICIPILALLITVLSFLPQNAHAAVGIDVNNQASCQAAPISGTWTASNSTCRTTANLKINHGDVLIFENATLVSTGVIDNSGLIEPGAIYHPFHTGLLINYGTINNNNDGQLAITGAGFITNARQGAINNLGSIFINTNSKGIYGITNSGTINNYNLIRVDGFFKNLVQGVVNNNGTFWNDEVGYTTNKFGATINNYGTLNNTAIIDFGANFNNLGTITNKGTIFNQITTCKLCGPNSVVFNNSGTVANSGSFINSQVINEYCAGTITGNPVSGNPPVINGCVPLHNTTTSVTPNPAGTVVGQKITFHVKVIDSSSGAKILPTGLVKWDDGGAGGTFSSGSCTLTPLTSISACAIIYAPPSTAGPVTITASYAGDSNHNPSSGASALSVS